MRVKFIRGTALGGIGNDAEPGDVIDLPDPQARAYLIAGRAVTADADQPPPTSPEAPSKTKQPKKAK